MLVLSEVSWLTKAGIKWSSRSGSSANNSWTTSTASFFYLPFSGIGQGGVGGKFASGLFFIKLERNSVRAYSLLPCEHTQKYSRLLHKSTPKYSILLQGSTPKYSLLPCESTQKYSIILWESTPKYSTDVLQSTPDHTKYSKVLRGSTPKYSRRY